MAISAGRTFNVFNQRRTTALSIDQVSETGLLQASEYVLVVQQILGQEFRQPGSAASQGAFNFLWSRTGWVLCPQARL